MDIKQILPGYGVTSQLDITDLSELAALGYRSVINYRPDDEEPGQPKSDDLLAEAKRLNLEYMHLPISGMDLPDEPDIRSFGKTLDALPEPVLGFCRTGARAVRLWSVANAGKHQVDDIVAAVENAGYQIDDLKPRLNQLAETSATETAADS